MGGGNKPLLCVSAVVLSAFGLGAIEVGGILAEDHPGGGCDVFEGKVSAL